jgi:predicted RNA-binding protein with TRAM domain
MHTEEGRCVLFCVQGNGMENEEGTGKSYEQRPGMREGNMEIKPNYFLPKPVKVGDEVDVKIENVTSKGDGIARIDGYVVFVKGAKKGDKVMVRITDVKARFAIGEMVTLA